MKDEIEIDLAEAINKGFRIVANDNKNQIDITDNIIKKYNRITKENK